MIEIILNLPWHSHRHCVHVRTILTSCWPAHINPLLAKLDAICCLIPIKFLLRNENGYR